MAHGFVHIVESPSPDDLLDSRTEGRALSEALQLTGIPFEYSLAVDASTFAKALSAQLASVESRHGIPPIVHLSVHGNEQGLGLTNGTFISWHALRDLLLPLMRSMPNELLICLSSCKGGHGCAMAMYEDKEPTFYGLVGNREDVGWGAAAVAYIAFYHRLLTTESTFREALDAMRAASGDNGFVVLAGEPLREKWIQQQNAKHQRVFEDFLRAADQMRSSPRADGTTPP